MSKRALTFLPTAACLLAVCLAAPALGQAPAGTAAPADATNPSLMKAYQKEFVFLRNEKASLEKRLQETREEQKRRVAQARAEIDRLQDRFLARSAEADAARQELKQAEARLENYEEIGEILDSTLYQAMTTLEQQGIRAPAFAEDPVERKKQEVAFTFASALDLLGKRGGVSREEGFFFLTDGTKTAGTLLHVGAVATLGVSDRESGSLAPAGGGYLKVWNAGGDAAAAAQALLDQGTPDRLPLYLYESLNQMAQVSREKSVAETIRSGGVIAYVIVVLGAGALLMLVLRAFFLWKSGANTARLVEKIAPLVETGEAEKPLAILDQERGAAARVLASTVRHIRSDPDQLEDIISESILHETPYLERFEAAILVFAGVAPLLGLLGTVTGMISTFDVITEFGTGDPKLLSGGISEALVTTELGLIVAIPTLLIGSLLTGWSERIKAGMETAALRVTNLFRMGPAAAPAREAGGERAVRGAAAAPVRGPAPEPGPAW